MHRRCRGGIACLRFGKDVVNGHVRDLLLDNADVFLVGHHPHVLYRTDGLEAVDGELDEERPTPITSMNCFG